MKLYYYRDPVGNFGDDLNLWLWPHLVPGIFVEDDERLFLGIGTLLNHRVPAEPIKVVCGAGFGYGTPPRLDDRWSIQFVRGPLTAEALGLRRCLAVADPAMLVPTLGLVEEGQRAGVGFMPHHISSTLSDWSLYCQMARIRYIDPRAGLFDVIRAIRNCEVLVTESLHGAIVADAFRVPWIALHLFEHVNEFKWRDWCASVQVKYDPMRLREFVPRGRGRRARAGRAWRSARVLLGLRKMIRGLRPALSSDDVFATATSRLQEKVQLLHDQVLAGRLE